MASPVTLSVELTALQHQIVVDEGQIANELAGVVTGLTGDVQTTVSTAISNTESALDTSLNTINTGIGTLGAELGTTESQLESQAGLSPALVGALTALALIEAGGTLPPVSADVANIEKTIPNSVLGEPISVAEAVGLTPKQAQLVTNYVDNKLQQEEQTVLTDLSPAALSLLQVNYNTTFYPSGKNPVPSPVTRTTLGYIGLPMVLDVDGQPGLDLCGDTELDLGSLATLATSILTPAELQSLGTSSITALESLNSGALLGQLGSLLVPSLSNFAINQQISKLPLAATSLPVDVNAVLPNFGNFGFGYLTKGSSAPLGYTTSIKVGSSPLLSLSDTTIQPGPSLTQTISLGSTVSIDNTWTPVPSTMTDGLTLGGSGGTLASFANTVSSPSDWTFSLPLSSTEGITANVNELTSTTPSTLSLGLPGAGIQADYSGGTATSTSFNGSINLGTQALALGVAPLPTSFDSCTDLGAVACSDVNMARGLSLTALSSMHFTASSAATATQSVLVATPTITAISPASGPSIGGNTVTITGTGFGTNPGGTVIMFGPNAAGNVTCSKTTTCTATVPTGSLGAANVSATTNGVTSVASSASRYNYTASLGTRTTFATPTNSCGNALTAMYAKVTGSDVYQDYTWGSSGGHAWVDTGGAPVSGCSTGLGFVATYAPGTTAGGSTPPGRLGTFTGTGAAANSLTKTGAMTCPVGTNFNWSALGVAGILLGVPASGDETDWLCPTPPSFTKAPVVSPTSPAYVTGTLSTTSGTFAPTNEVSTPGIQWERCTTATSCSPITGATSSTYSPATLDLGDTIESVATVTSNDGSASSPSNQTVAVTLPPPPSIVTAPVVTSPGPGVVTSTPGSFSSPVPDTVNDQWYLCTTPSNCSQIVGATGLTYSVTPGSDQGDLLEMKATATNAGGSTTATSNQFAVPPVPSNSSIPTITDTTQGIADASGQDVIQGDILSANNGTWNPTTGVGYHDVWSDCNASLVCTPIAGGTSPTYTLAKTDVGSSIELTVTASDFSGTQSASSNLTHPVSPNSLSFLAPSSVVDGTVNATAADGNGGTYVGGSFDTIGPGVGEAGSIPVASPTGKAVTLAAGATGGAVSAMAGDGSGGYYIGGSFTKVKGANCPSLAHITSAGALDTNFCFSTSSATPLVGTVSALDLTNGLVAVGGGFTFSGHSNLVFFSSAASPSYVAGGDPNGAVTALTDDHSTNPAPTTPNFFAGGAFTSIGGTAVEHLAKLPATASSGTVATASWPAAICSANPSINALAVAPVSLFNGTTGNVTSSAAGVVVGGSFTQVKGSLACSSPSNRLNAAVFSVSAAALGTWEPDPSNGGTGGDVNAITTMASPSHSGTVLNVYSGFVDVYLGGDFSTVKQAATTLPVHNLADYGMQYTLGVLAGPGAGTNDYSSPDEAWTPGSNGSVRALAAGSDGNLYLAGAFTSVSEGAVTTVRHRVASITPATATTQAVNSWDPNAGKAVNALVASGTNVLVGGSFIVLGGTTYNNVADLDATGTVVPTFNPGTDAPVSAIAATATDVFVGGSFAHVGLVAAPDLGEVTTAGAPVAGFVPAPNGTVLALATANNTLYVGGAFSSIAGTAHNGLAAFNSSSGAPASWSPVLANGSVVSALGATSGDVYAGGSLVAGSQQGAAAFDTLTATRAPWNPIVTSGSVSAIAVTPGGGPVYLGGLFTTTAGSDLVAVDPGSGADEGFNAGVNGTVDAMALSGDGSALYAGGSFTTLGGASRANLGSVLTATGSHTTFNPGPSGPVNALTLTPSAGQDTLAVGGSFVTIGQFLTGGFGQF